MDTPKRIEKIIRESSFDKKKKKRVLKFSPELAVTGDRTTGPLFLDSWVQEPMVVRPLVVSGLDVGIPGFKTPGSKTARSKVISS